MQREMSRLKLENDMLKTERTSSGYRLELDEDANGTNISFVTLSNSFVVREAQLHAIVYDLLRSQRSIACEMDSVQMKISALMERNQQQEQQIQVSRPQR